MKTRRDLGIIIVLSCLSTALIGGIITAIISSTNYISPSVGEQENRQTTTPTIVENDNNPDNTLKIDSTAQDDTSATENGDTIKHNNPETSSDTSITPIIPSSTPTASPSCYHQENGRCWDDLEDEAYSAGMYDKQFGYYGASLEYPDHCNAFCRDTLEDAYDEGWYDSY